jgi:hypothetical protein
MVTETLASQEDIKALYHATSNFGMFPWRIPSVGKIEYVVEYTGPGVDIIYRSFLSRGIEKITCYKVKANFGRVSTGYEAYAADLVGDKLGSFLDDLNSYVKRLELYQKNLGNKKSIGTRILESLHLKEIERYPIIPNFEDYGEKREITSTEAREVAVAIPIQQKSAS